MLSSPNRCSYKRTCNKIKLNGRVAAGPAYTMSPVAVCGMINELLAKDPDHNQDSTSTFEKDGEQKPNVMACELNSQHGRPFGFWQQHDRGWQGALPLVVMHSMSNSFSCLVTCLQQVPYKGRVLLESMYLYEQSCLINLMCSYGHTGPCEYISYTFYAESRSRGHAMQQQYI